MAHTLPHVVPGSILRTNAADAVLVTFDDGPAPASTPALLDVLERECMKALHFHVGSRVRQHAGLTRQCAETGHALGCHGDVHERMFGLRRRYAVEIADAVRAITDASGIVPRWFRPPYGWWNPLNTPTLTRQHLRLMLWSAMPGDFLASFSADTFERWLRRHLRGGDIIVLHDQPRLKELTSRIVPMLARVMREKGLRALRPGEIEECTA